MKKLIVVAVIVAIASLFGNVAAATRVEKITGNHETKIQITNKTVESATSSPFATPLLKRACSCESWGDPNKQPREFYPDGRLIKGFPDPSDEGACQIHTPTWQKEADVLGYNIETYEGNVKMANYIYGVQGMAAWNASKSCWQE